MRCPDCSKFVPYDTEADPDANLEISDEGQLTGEVRRCLPCGECGTELKETTFDFDQNLNEILKIEGNEDDSKAFCPNGEAHKWDWEKAGEPSVSPTTDTQTTDRKGKKITNPRYMTTLYGVEVDGEVVCSVCGAKATYNLGDTAAASSFDELT